ncbi:hypothetical protein BLA39750_01449 [Burkholderia lata]|uniref:Heme oxygenase-like protein n=1 Tax=Burkholderia lata (strain ATCC 17760 / DSM 23089 / LMG 22485 / NCIMB 9086 / R18194 / 383) TaxID=482957 RepID=A0A6P2W0P5_BURL3|nr:hypothetical protein [Burkholderia lata]VWC84757.1 hypothetical protein BLA39750_01449 [Burkholderia lata]
MEAVLAHVRQNRKDYESLPLFDRLRNDRLPPLARLEFMRGFMFFVMAFGDLNRYVLRAEPPADAHQARVNAHTREDDHHWPWFLEDVETLGWNDTTTVTDALRMLWSEQTYRSRLLMYELCAIVAEADGVERLAVIEAIEETGNVLFALTTRVAAQVHVQTGRELRYLGAFHFALESGHLQNGEHAERLPIALGDDRRAHCITLVDRVFRAFAAWTHEATRQIDLAATGFGAMQAARSIS